MDPVKSCPGPSGSITEYQINIQIGSLVYFESVNASMCINGLCIHTFEPAHPNHSLSYDSVSAAAKNVVGVGAARTCTAQPISKLNYELRSLGMGVNV